MVSVARSYRGTVDRTRRKCTEARVLGARLLTNNVVMLASVVKCPLSRVRCRLVGSPSVVRLLSRRPSSRVVRALKTPLLGLQCPYVISLVTKARLNCLFYVRLNVVIDGNDLTSLAIVYSNMSLL